MQKLFEIASSIATPLALGGFFAAAVFLIFRQIVEKDIFPQLTKSLGANILKLIIEKLFILALIAMILGFVGYIVRTFVPDPPKSVVEDRAGDQLRLVVRGVTFGLKNGKSELGAWLSVSNVGRSTLLIDNVGVVMNARSRKDGSVLASRRELARNMTINEGSIVPIELPNTEIAWEKMGQPTDEVPSWDAYFFSMFLQIIATVAGNGQKVRLDIEVPKPVPMTCGYPCVAVYDLNVPAGKTSYKKCTALPAGLEWKLDCVSNEKM